MAINGLSIEQYSSLIRALVIRDIRSRYRRTILGPVWAIVQPLFLMVVFTALRGFIDVPKQDIPYALFSFSVLVPWTFFVGAVNRAGGSIMGNASILKKLPLAREVFPVAAVLTTLFDLLMSGIVLVGMMLWYHVTFNWSLLWLPLLVLLTGVFALGLGLLLAAVGTFKSDFLFVGQYILQAGVYLAPIIYPLDSVPNRWYNLYILNPMVGLLEGFRSVLAYGNTPDLTLLAHSLPGIILTWVIAWPVFRLMSRYFADVL